MKKYAFAVPPVGLSIMINDSEKAANI